MLMDMQDFADVTMDGGDTMTFISEDISSSLLQRLYEQKKTSRFCDITLYVNNKIIKAHRNVLACASPYFDSILKQHKILREQLTVTCMDVEIFNSMINYMYTGQLIVEQNNVEELLRLADHFIMTKVIEYCIEFLGTKLSLENCLFTYYLTHRFKLRQLGNLVENWIVTHINEVCDGTEILTLSIQDLQNFLRNKVFCISIVKALKIMSDWVLKNTDREKDYNKLLNCVQWANVEQNDIFKHLELCTLYSKSELCLYYFLTYLVRNNLLLPNFKSKFDMLHLKYEQVLQTQEKFCEDFNKQNEVNKILVMERDSTNLNSLVIKAKERNRKQLFLRKLMLGLRPSLRMAAFKALMPKKKRETPETSEDESEKASDVKCPICFENLDDSQLLEQHLAISHAKDVTYKCGICSFVCQYNEEYLNHMKSHFAGPPFKCDYCDASFEDVSKLVSHRSKHLEESVFQCTFCSFKCRQKQNFISHLKIHTPDKTYKCDSCTKTFRFKHSLESHLLTHQTPDKILNCDSCGFHTKFLNHMIAHKRIHAGDVYRCSYPHCKYSTSKKNQLASHTKSHNGVRPHSCNICGRGFMEKSHLVRHERIHLDEKPFKCSNCDYASSRRDKLKEHFTRHHGENASAKVPYKARPMRNTPAAATINRNITNNNTNNNNVNTNNKSNGASNNIPDSPVPSSSANNSNNASSVVSLSFNSNAAALNSANGNNSDANIQDLILHQNGASPSGNYHHFGDPNDFHHHNHTTHNLQQQILSGHNQRSGQHHNNMVNHHMLGRGNHTAASSTAAAVAAAMMLDPRFHHNSTVPYHPTATPVSMAMAAVQSSQQIQGSTQHSEYPPTLQNCMTLF